MLRACSEACISDDQSPEVAIRRRRMISWHRGRNRVIWDVTTWLKDVRAYAAKGEAPRQSIFNFFAPKWSNSGLESGR